MVYLTKIYMETSNLEIQDIQKCPFCGEEISIQAKKCKYCGEWLIADKPIQKSFIERPAQPQVTINQIEHKSNGIGTAGFIIAVLGICLFWVPIVNLVLLAIGALLSFFGMFKSPRSWAIVGFIISIINFCLIGKIASFFIH